MPKLIDADKLKEHYAWWDNEDKKIFDTIIDLQPIVDAKPVRHGHWIFNPKDAIEMMFTLPKCSECGAESSDGGNYCSNCGAKMDGERREDD